jgi:hypothetical protein
MGLFWKKNKKIATQNVQISSQIPTLPTLEGTIPSPNMVANIAKETLSNNSFIQSDDRIKLAIDNLRLEIKAREEALKILESI